TLDGTRVHLAAMALNTAAGYNQVVRGFRKGAIIGNGYFEAGPNNTRPVRFTRGPEEQADVRHLEVNARFAHMSVEALRCVAHYAFVQEVGGAR
ncbi:hypothetical protein NIL11_27185, partial [Klebsiella pneumoniae]|uniref:hypothetical protein n=1 Tax=Klebsiella pneumoniae TaxID=573 RepID=UPI0021F6CABA